MWLAQPKPECDVPADALLAGEEPGPSNPRTRQRLWAATGLSAAAAAASGLWLLALAGHWQPEAIGLPPAAMPEADATRAAIAGLGPWLPDVAPLLPSFSIAAVRVPEALPPPLDVRARTVVRPVPGGGRVWEVRGQISNPGPHSEAVPPLELSLTDADGRLVARWTMRADIAQLSPGAAVAFQTSAVNPPAQAHAVSIRLRPASVARL